MASRSWNRVELIGNLTRDPELRFTPSGAAVATFGIATNRSYMVNGERKEDVDFHKVVAWNKLAELCNQLLKKGARVFVSGRLQYREWTGQDQIKRRDAEIVLEDMLVVTPKSGGSYGEGTAEETPKEEAAPQEPVKEEVVSEKTEDSEKQENKPSSPAKASNDKDKSEETPAAPPPADENVGDLPF